MAMRRKVRTPDEVLAAEARRVSGDPDETHTVRCKGCGAPVKWTGLYGDWCATCKPRGPLPGARP